MAAPSTNPLASLLARSGLLSREQAELCAMKAADAGINYLLYLHDHKLLDHHKLTDLLSNAYGMPIGDIADYDLNELPDNCRNEKLILKHFALPVQVKDNRLHVAVADPTNLAALEDFQFAVGLRTEPVLVDVASLRNAIDKLLGTDGAALDVGDVSEKDLASVEAIDTDAKDDDIVGANDKDDGPIVKFINARLLDAIRKGASDLHFEPYEHTYRVRFRIDGILHEVAAPPVALSGRMAARLKVMSKLDIAERRLPQDGRIKLRLSRTKAIDFRVSTLPTLWGEKVVLRILDSSSAQLGIDVLGYEPEQKALYMKALAQPQGMILVTGPTGSGKTVSLYTGLNILNTAERNIATAEDPVEINLAGINQVQMNNKAGLTFASALRAFLRQDPDVVMVGEIRDLETAEIAIKAAQTGHLVLSTLHTNSAAETLTRLLNMGVPSYNVASSVTLIIAQRLARRLCSHCKAPENISPQQLKELGFSEEQIAAGFTIYKPVGCDQCSGGYKGRVGIYEVMPITETIAKIIMEGGNSLDIAAQAQREGVKNLRQSALKKAADGVTSLVEVERVTAF